MEAASALVATKFYEWILKLIRVEEEHVYTEDRPGLRVGKGSYEWATFPSWKSIIDWNAKDKDTAALLDFIMDIIPVPKDAILAPKEKLLEQVVLEKENQKTEIGREEELFQKAFQAATEALQFQEGRRKIASDIDSECAYSCDSEDTRINELIDKAIQLIESANFAETKGNFISTVENGLYPVSKIISTQELVLSIKDKMDLWAEKMLKELDDIVGECYNICTNDINSLNIILDQARYISDVKSIEEFENLKKSIDSLEILCSRRMERIDQVISDLVSVRKKESVLLGLLSYYSSKGFPEAVMAALESWINDLEYQENIVADLSASIIPRLSMNALSDQKDTACSKNEQYNSLSQNLDHIMSKVTTFDEILENLRARKAATESLGFSAEFSRAKQDLINGLDMIQKSMGDIS
jgi:hypothetical protein